MSFTSKGYRAACIAEVLTSLTFSRARNRVNVSACPSLARACVSCVLADSLTRFLYSRRLSHVSCVLADSATLSFVKDLPFGEGLNPNIHTARDTINILNMTQTLEFTKVLLIFRCLVQFQKVFEILIIIIVKVSVAFAVELSLAPGSAQRVETA